MTSYRKMPFLCIASIRGSFPGSGIQGLIAMFTQPMRRRAQA